MKKKLVHRIIVLRFRRVGDAVLSGVICTSLRRSFPTATIDYVLNAEIAPLFENHPDVDRIISFTKDEMGHWSIYLKKVWHIMCSARYDLIVDTRATVKTLWFSLFSIRTPYRIGWKKSYNLFLHNYRVMLSVDSDQVSCLLSLLRPLEKRFQMTYEPNFTLFVTPEERAAFRVKMENAGINFSKPVIVCAVATRIPHKNWNVEKMRQVLERIIEHYDAQLIFNFAGVTEEELAVQLYCCMNHHPQVHTNVRADNLRELAALISLSDFFFGNEGGPRHISQAFRIPSFAIYPPSVSKRRWLPGMCERYRGIELADISGEKVNNPNLNFASKFDLLTVDHVWEELNPMLAQYL
ncbi:MAG: glycosyltransferase family 9 protein [Tannerella sp.]|jgi:heptosyltransferase-2|nr:glycosyltransferase family 9 protein [Tannerella sp.]